jgi:hypothetical protein
VFVLQGTVVVVLLNGRDRPPAAAPGRRQRHDDGGVCAAAGRPVQQHRRLPDRHQRLRRGEAIGSYGVLSYMVSERRREIGIRTALGADRGSVRRMVLGRRLTLTLAGVMVGSAAAFGLTGVLASLLFGMRPTDPLTIAAVVLLISGMALIACYLPARVATRVDPMIVLRDE